jgi:two-component system NarL family sensor kinase
MKYKLLLAILFCVVFVSAQPKQIDSFKKNTLNQSNDSLQIIKFYELAKDFEQKKDAINATKNYLQGISLSKKIKKHVSVVKGYNELSYYNILNTNYTDALTYLSQAIIYGKQNNVIDELGRSYFYNGTVFNSLKKFDTSIENYLVASELFKKSNNLKRLGNCCHNTGNSFYAKSNFEKALDYYYKAVDFYEKANEQKLKGSVTMNIGVINYNLKNYDIALKFFNQAKVIAKNNNDELQILNVNANIASIYHGQKKYNEAIPVLKENLKLNEKIKNRNVERVSTSTLASCYERIGDEENAEKYLKAALIIAQEDDDKESLIINYNNYASFLSGTNRLNEAITLEKKALAIAKTSPEFLKFKHTLYSSLAAFYNEINDMKSAFLYKDSQIVHKELLINETSNGKLLELQTKYETNLKENKISLLNKSDSLKGLQVVAQQLAISKNLFDISQQKFALAEDSLMLFSQNQTILQNRLDSTIKEKKINTLTKEGLQKELALQQKQAAIKQKNNTIIIVAISSALLLLIGYGLFRKKQLEQKAILATEQAKQREQLTKAVIDAEENERKRIGSDLHDGVGQLFSAVKMNLSGLFDRINFESNNEKFLAEKTLALVDESCKEVRIISHKMMPNTLLKSGIASDIKSFIEKLDEQNLKVNFSAKGFSDQLEHNEEVILYKVIQELVSNIIKHAKASELTIAIENDKKFIRALIKDNGVGFNVAAIDGFTGIGLKNINTRIQYLKGTVHFDSAPNKGTAVSIMVPLG